MAVSLVPVVLIAALFTEATITPAAFLAAVGATVVAAVPFTLMGLAIGYSLPSKAAIVVAQVLFFPLAFGGGLMTAPGSAPGFVETIAPYLPTGGAVRLMWAAVGDYPGAARFRRRARGLDCRLWVRWRHGPIDATRVGGSARTSD